MLKHLHVLCFICLIAPCHSQPLPVSGTGLWVRPETTSSPLVWGRRDGIVFGLPSQGGLGGPRGLIRVGVVGPESGKPELVNFIAIEPVTSGAGDRFSRMAFSELEKSELDPGKPGKRLWTDNPLGDWTTHPLESISVRIEVERFTANNARVWLTATVRGDRPDELVLSVHHHDDSAPIEELTLSATMGNKERLRWLWLRNAVVDSRELYAGYDGDAFIEKEPYALDRMLSWNGDPIAIATTNELNPTGVPVPEKPMWTYKSRKLTQYWRVPASDVQPGLRTRVNGRRVYWASNVVIPGGISFENFEVRQPYLPGQASIFGLTSNEPSDFKPAISDLSSTPTVSTGGPN